MHGAEDVARYDELQDRVYFGTADGGEIERARSFSTVNEIENRVDEKYC